VRLEGQAVDRAYLAQGGVTVALVGAGPPRYTRTETDGSFYFGVRGGEYELFAHTKDGPLSVAW